MELLFDHLGTRQSDFHRFVPSFRDQVLNLTSAVYPSKEIFQDHIAVRVFFIIHLRVKLRSKQHFMSMRNYLNVSI